jgi:hypothetical protein
MTQEAVSLESQAAMLSDTANETVHELTESAGIDQHPMTSALQAMGFSSAIGTAAFVGRYASGDYAVQFNTGNTGYSSIWPAWAAEVAKGALENGKQLWVGSNGDPFGSNLVFVLELA